MLPNTHQTKNRADVLPQIYINTPQPYQSRFVKGQLPLSLLVFNRYTVPVVVL